MLININHIFNITSLEIDRQTVSEHFLPVKCFQVPYSSKKLKKHHSNRK